MVDTIILGMGVVIGAGCMLIGIRLGASMVTKVFTEGTYDTPPTVEEQELLRAIEEEGLYDNDLYNEYYQSLEEEEEKEKDLPN